MVKWGNEKCNLYWEAKLPQGYVPDSSKIENFIRTKYDMKKWVALPRVPDPMTLHTSGPQQTHGPAEEERASKQKLVHVASGKSQTKSELLLDDDFGSFSSAPTKSSQHTGIVSSQSQTKGNAHTASASSPLNNRGNLLSAKSSSEPPSDVVPDQRKDLKKSILSLYSTPSSSSSSLSFNNGTSNGFLGIRSTGTSRAPATQSFQFQQPMGVQSGTLGSALQPARSPTTDSVNSMSDSLLGLNFGAPSKPAVAKPAAPSPVYASSNSQTPVHTPNQAQHSKANTPAQSWNNEWSNLPASDNPWGSMSNSQSSSSVLGRSSVANTGFDSRTKDLEDDLFKNVWT